MMTKRDREKSSPLKQWIECKTGTLVAIFIVAFVCFRPDVQAAPILSVNSPLTSAAPGETFSVGIDITDVSDLFAFQIGILFDPLILNASAVTEGGFLATVGSTFFLPGFLDNLTGLIAFNANTLLGPVAGVSGSGRILNFEFLAIAVGTSVISILLDPLNADGLLDSALNPISAIGVENGLAVVAPATVPEPTTILLVALGLLGLAINRKNAK